MPSDSPDERLKPGEEVLAVRLPSRQTRVARKLLQRRLSYPRPDALLTLTDDESGAVRRVRVVRSPSLTLRRRTGYVVVKPVA